MSDSPTEFLDLPVPPQQSRTTSSHVPSLNSHVVFQAVAMASRCLKVKFLWPWPCLWTYGLGLEGPGLGLEGPGLDLEGPGLGLEGLGLGLGLARCNDNVWTSPSNSMPDNYC